MTAESIATALGGRKAGGGWAARCPAHDDREPSLSVRDADHGKILVRCHAGCDQARVIAALRARGLWKGSDHLRGRLIRSGSSWVGRGRPDREGAERTDAALRLWRAATGAAGTPVRIYLRSRGITIAVPSTLRFHPRLKHPSGGRWPAMVALVTRGPDDAPLAIHRTFLARDGAGKAPVTPSKMMLGPCRGGAVRLAPLDSGMLMAGEGIETCLAAMQATGHPAWAALSTSGLRALDLPVEARDVVLLADGDEPGEAAARAAALRWRREGRTVRLARPPRGLDFNDMLLGSIPQHGRGAA
jgi:hypothetical protein